MSLAELFNDPEIWDSPKTNKIIKAIPTRYKGYHFRSRLEARTAVALDHANISWLYENEGFDIPDVGYYLPDFWLPELNTFIEVKPDYNLQEFGSAHYKLAKLCMHKDAFGAIIHDLSKKHLNIFPGVNFNGVATIDFEYYMEILPFNTISYHRLNKRESILFGKHYCPICGDARINMNPDIDNHLYKTNVEIDIPHHFYNMTGYICANHHHWVLVQSQTNNYIDISEHFAEFLAPLDKDFDGSVGLRARFEHGESGPT